MFCNNYVRFPSLDLRFNINYLRFASIFKFFNINQFASLRFSSSLIKKCSLRFKIDFQTIERVRCASIFKSININSFASLRNRFSNYRTCSLRFDIEENIIIEAFASLRFDNLVICFWCFWTIDACAVPGGVYTTEPEPHPDVSALQRPVLFLEMSTPQIAGSRRLPVSLIRGVVFQIGTHAKPFYAKTSEKPVHCHVP